MRIFLLYFFFILSASLLSQELEQRPISWEIGLRDIAPIELPPIDLVAIQAEDSINDLDKSLPWRYGILRPIVLDLREQGNLTVLNNGGHLYRMAIKSPNAVNLSVNFDGFYLPKGARLQMYNPSKTDFSKVYTANNNRWSKLLGSWYITGDVIVLEYYQPPGIVTPPVLKIGNIIHGYRMGKVDDLVNPNPMLGFEDSGDCNYDVNCSVGSDFEERKNKLKKAVALLNLGNGHLCSSVLVNNTEQNKTPYLLTANHCLQDSNPQLWSVRFNWVSPNPVCGTPETSTNVQNNFTISGAELRASNALSDFALVELYSDIPDSWDVAFAGWDRSDSTPLYEVGIHHPNGDIMKVCRDNDPAMKDIANGTKVWLIKGHSVGNGNGWDLGTTESGSSGSPLFNQEGRIIGQLYAGLSSCNGVATNGEYDIYGRFAVSWDAGSTPQTRLKDWLDPFNTGVMAVNTLENSLNIGEFEYEGQLSVYPNPANDYVFIMNPRYPNLRFELFNTLGQLLLSGKASNTESRLSIGDLSEGIYFLYLIDEDSQNDVTKKIIVQR
ncbi:MAG TPA: T9SS type A sorting domain-containing protein [Flavobacteriaceae bacterium]|nr:T9SS type A sorting domain-containing protein [Flavobacteriaceae bacterium]MCB9213063.1 T9SS type A sorting domain-containing protein [Alteromonas sp.]HPF10968.1 T9SS type A sorting domain-containing protein [Flavobacteriaceae bacterium]HQU20290.1 T9SS type A sorting domain-containing protein [Flavobacteriaceae bacterium]HQU64182.1 T9SS type A sorting domain-containing protein [Flavobacteriaceae bacterium]